MILDDYLEAARDGWASLQRWVGFWGPVVPVPATFQPVAALGTLLALAATTGLALASLAFFLACVLFLHLLATRVLGVEIRVLGSRS